MVLYRHFKVLVLAIAIAQERSIRKYIFIQRETLWNAVSCNESGMTRKSSVWFTAGEKVNLTAKKK